MFISIKIGPVDVTTDNGIYKLTDFVLSYENTIHKLTWIKPHRSVNKYKKSSLDSLSKYIILFFYYYWLLYILACLKKGEIFIWRWSTFV